MTIQKYAVTSPRPQQWAASIWSDASVLMAASAEVAVAFGLSCMWNSTSQVLTTQVSCKASIWKCNQSRFWPMDGFEPSLGQLWVIPNKNKIWRSFLFIYIYESIS